MALTRRQLIQAAGGVAAAHTLLPAVGRVGDAFGAARPHPSSRKRNRLVVVFLAGGNDGLNTIVPRGGRDYDVYRKVRPNLSIPWTHTRKLYVENDEDHQLGLNPLLRTMYKLYLQRRMAIVQGVDYPGHSYSHFAAIDNWHSGTPGRGRYTGWLGRHLDRVGVREGELRAVGIGSELPLLLRGERRSGLQVRSLAATRFSDGTGAVADARHDALAMFENHSIGQPLRRSYGKGGRQATDLVDVLGRVPAAKPTGIRLADDMLTARSLLKLDLGVECVYMAAGAYDTHIAQEADHNNRMRELDAALEAFFFGTVRGQSTGAGPLPSSLAERTVVMVVSEFGRRIGENGTGSKAGTDHGAAGPVLLFGPPGRGANRTRLVPGIHGEHPPMGTTRAPADNLRMTTDMRRVFQAVLEDWLHDPDPLYRKLGPLRGLFD
jgi:uncharacterized protein (DUF1501 family)